MAEAVASSMANFLAGFIMLLFGLILRFVKDSAGMLSGFSGMSAKETAKWNLEAVRLFLGRAFLLASCILIAAGIFALLGIHRAAMLNASWGLFFLLLLFSVIHINTSKKFKAG